MAVKAPGHRMINRLYFPPRTLSPLFWVWELPNQGPFISTLSRQKGCFCHLRWQFESEVLISTSIGPER